MSAQSKIMPRDAAADVATMLLERGAVTRAQLDHAERVRSRLREHRTLLNTMLELGYFDQATLEHHLRGCGDAISLGALLVELGEISPSELEQAERMVSASQGRRELRDALLEQRHLSEARLLDVIALQHGIEHIEPDYSRIPKELLDELSPQWCEQYCMLPVRKDGDVVTLATPHPDDTSLRLAAESTLGREVRFAVCSPDALRTATQKHHYFSERRRAGKSGADGEVALIVDEILHAAVTHDTSDIHIEPTYDALRVRFRRDGTLWLYRSFDLDLARPLISRLKVLGEADISERRRHQDGKLEFHDPTTGQTIDIRASFYVSVHGETACLRLLNRKGLFLGIDEVGMTPKVAERFRMEVLDAPSGVVLITGPTGSGKTTTLYSAVDYLNDDNRSIITAEEPVEYVVEGITQCSLNPKIGRTFAESLRHMVRQDPDVIVLGEVRDQQSAEAAIQAALTGHKVLTTFHTEDTIGGLLRLMNMNIETFLISSTVISVLAQRLVRRVCSNCAKPYEPTEQDLARLGMAADDLKGGSFVHGEGCDYCHQTGYKGRLAIYELLIVNELVKDAILNRRPSYEIRRTSIDTTGMTTLLEDALLKAAEGTTTLAEITRVVPRIETPRPLEEIRRLTGGLHG
ncbi:MAG: GspE/PulE family protein [Pseudomonadales bacterium]|jgi:type IV pilus assembly protein PilB|nr:GspE/PulE family protein [Pseudomonadales bacterium]